MRRETRRRGVSVLEVVFVMVLLGILLNPILDLTQAARRTAAFDEFQVVARRQAERALAVLSSRAYADLRARAAAPSEPPPADPRIPPEVRELRIPIRVGADVLFDGLEPGDSDLAVDRVARTRVFLSDEGPGLLRLVAYVWWPVGEHRRGLALSRLVEDPLELGRGAR